MGTYRNTCPTCEDTYETDCWEPIKCPFCELLELQKKVIDLERWKNEAMTVLSEWDKAWVAAGKPGKMGDSIALATAKEITRLKTGIKNCDGTMCVDGNDMYDWGWLLPNNVKDLRAQLAAAKAETARIREVIESEPELPGDMPDAVWIILQSFSRDQMQAYLKGSVGRIKANILKRINTI